MRLRRVWLPALLVPLGCLNEYHPEYHSESAFTYIQNVSYPVTVVCEVPAPAPPSSVASHPNDAVRKEKSVATGSSRGGPAIAERADPPLVGRQAGEVPSRPAHVDKQNDAVALATWPEPDSSWQDLFAAEREQLRAKKQARVADSWEQVVGKPDAGGGETDIVADVTVAQAVAIARRTPLVNVPCMLQGFHAARWGTVVELRMHRQDDGLAQVLVKVDARWDPPWKNGIGKEVAMSFPLAKPVLVVGHVAGPAAEDGSEALVRARACQSDRQGLRCSLALRLARYDGA